MGYLIAALAASAAGPPLYGVLHDRPRAARAVDRFVFLAVPVLVAWQVIASAWEGRSMLPLVAVAAGISIPTLIERISHAHRHRTDSVALVVGLSGLFLHTLLEGAALAALNARPAIPFTLAVVLHRVVEGLVVWWLIRPRYGSGSASLGVAALLVSTVIGYALGIELLGGLENSAVDLYTSLVAGSLLHVVFHQGRADHDHGEHAHHHH